VSDLEAQLRELVRQEVKRELDARAAETGVDAAPADYITVAEYARRRSISQSTVRAAIEDGRLPGMKFGRALRVPASVEIGRPVRVGPENDNRAAAAAARADRRLGGR
jgi:excisionase family DNA binding protein